LLLLTNDDVEQVLTMADCVDVLRRFFQEAGKGQVLTRQRTESWLPHVTADTFYQCKTMERAVPYIGKYVIRIDSNVTRKKQQGQSSRVEHVPFGNGSWMGMLLVFSTETGELLGWMPDGYLQRTRVGALYALAADYLTRPDAAEVGLIGSGWQAGGQILGLRCVRDIKKVRVYSSNANRRSRFAEELQKSLKIEVRPVAAARDALAGADIVALATNANEKVMESAWIEAGQHVSSVRFLELDPRAYEDCDRVVVNRAEPWKIIISASSVRRTSRMPSSRLRRLARSRPRSSSASGSSDPERARRPCFPTKRATTSSAASSPPWPASFSIGRAKKNWAATCLRIGLRRHCCRDGQELGC
jgi:ornithine cyclodeaminase/alanine dehydrogenase-like protein (mu-crystallin family)